MHGFHIATNWKKSCWNSGTLQVWPYARSLRAEMLQKSLRGLTPTTFWLTPEALTATLLLKMNRGVLDVAQLQLPLDCRLDHTCLDFKGQFNNEYSMFLIMNLPTRLYKIRYRMTNRKIVQLLQWQPLLHLLINLICKEFFDSYVWQ